MGPDSSPLDLLRGGRLSYCHHLMSPPKAPGLTGDQAVTIRRSDSGGGKPRGMGTQNRTTSPTLGAYRKLPGLEEVAPEWDLEG